MRPAQRATLSQWTRIAWPWVSMDPNENGVIGALAIGMGFAGG